MELSPHHTQLRLSRVLLTAGDQKDTKSIRVVRRTETSNGRSEACICILNQELSVGLCWLTLVNLCWWQTEPATIVSKATLRSL